MIHGYCINCWWYKPIKGKHYVITNSGLKEKFGNGKCYMHGSEEGDFIRIEGDSYCPDYLNRERGNKSQKMTLEDWLDNSLDNLKK